MVLMAITTVTAVSAFTGCGTAKENGQTPENSADTENAADTNTAETDSANAEAADADTAANDSESSQNGSFFSALNTTTLDGEKIDSSVFAKNKVTLVNLWNVGCTPCVQEIPILDKLNKEYEGKDAAIVGLYFAPPAYLEQERPDIDDILSRAGADYTQLTLTQEMYDSDLLQSVQAYPTTYVVDSEGNIVNTVEGSNDYEGWKSFIEDELKKAE